jgi:hypothetical protein
MQGTGILAFSSGTDVLRPTTAVAVLAKTGPATSRVPLKVVGAVRA